MADFCNRREFIKRALQSAAVLGCYPILSYGATEKLAPETEGVEKHVTGCMWCQGGCSMIVHVRDGRALHLTGNPDDPLTRGRICVKPYGSLELLNSPQRLTTPLKRIGGRGDDARFVALSWDEALGEIADKLKSIRKRHGGEALGIWASGRSAADGRKLNRAFARLYGTPNYEKTGPFCNYSGKPAGISVVGSRHTPWTYADDDFFAADLYIFIGSNMAATRPVIFSRLKGRKRRGECRFVVIDPRRSPTAAIADSWLAIKPGRDLALGLGLIHYIISNDLVDRKFVVDCTTGFDRLKAEILGGGYDLEWTAAVTGLPAAEIVSLARTYASTRRAIIVGNAGVSHHTNSVQTHRVFYLLAAVTGHFGEKSMGYSCLNNGGISTGSLPLPQEMVPKTPPELSKNPMGWLESLEDPAYPYRLRALIATGSPMTQWPDQSRLRKLMAKLDLSVYNGLTKNINACYFDYILPAATWIEAGGLAPVADDSRLVWVPRLVTPPGEARPDRWWWIELGKRMGWGKIFTDELKDPVFLQNRTGAAKGYRVKNFIARADNALKAPVREVNGRIEDRSTLFLDRRFPTPSGRIELWSEKLEKNFAVYGLSAIPRYYTDPDLADRRESTIIDREKRLLPSPFQKNRTLTRKVVLGKATGKGLPLYLVTGRPSAAIMGHTSHWIKRLNRRSPDQYCLIHRATAKKLGLGQRQRIRLISPHGETEAVVLITDHIRRDTVFVPYSYGEKAPFTSWRSVNFLTGMAERCPISGQIAFKGGRVRIERIAG